MSMWIEYNEEKNQEKIVLKSKVEKNISSVNLYERLGKWEQIMTLTFYKS